MILLEMNNRLCLLGKGDTGKTTYLQTLAYHYGGKLTNGTKAGNSFQPETTLTCRLDIKKPSGLLKLLKPTSMTVEIYDIPGEIFENLAQKDARRNEKLIDLLKFVDGCIIFVSEIHNTIDTYNYYILETFTSLPAADNLPYCIVATKVERGELWPCRLDAEKDLFENLYPKTTALLRSRIPAKNLRFFAISNFGILGQGDLRPNKVSKLVGNKYIEVLRDASRWQPYNLLAPLQWLASKKKHV